MLQRVPWNSVWQCNAVAPGTIQHAGNAWPSQALPGIIGELTHFPRCAVTAQHQHFKVITLAVDNSDIGGF